jgi:hypothetical protein
MEPLLGWEAAWACHEVGHAAMLLWHGLTFQYIEMRSPDPNCWAKLVGYEHPTPDPPAKVIAMKVSAAGPTAQERFAHHRRGLPTEQQLRDRLNGVPADEQSDYGAFKRMGIALDAQLVVTQPAHITGPEHWVGIWRQAEQEIIGPLWAAVEAMATVAMDQARNRFLYDELAAAAALLPDRPAPVKPSGADGEFTVRERGDQADTSLRG